MTIVQKYIDQFWLKYKSIPFAAIALILPSLFSLPEPGECFDYRTWIWLGSAIFLIIFYSLACYKSNQIPKAKKGQNAVLFVVDAETDQFFNDVKKKIVETFESAEYNKGEFQALCIKSERIKKVDLTKKDQAVELLEKAQCVFLVLVKYRVDNVSNAENYEMRINSGVLHPYFEHSAMQILQHDLNDLMRPIQKSKFVKKQTIDVCNVTAVSLSIVCSYILGLVFLFTGKCEEAHSLFRKINVLTKSANLPDGYKGLASIVRNRLFISCIQIERKCLEEYSRDWDEKHLDKLSKYLDEANTIYPNTYEYNMQKAYYCIAKNLDSKTARAHIAMCKKQNTAQEWEYSEAFLFAFDGFAARSIIRKYNKAFKVNYNLVYLVAYIEHIIEKAPEHIGLHLAAGLIYDQLQNNNLAALHLEKYLQLETDDKTKNATEIIKGMINFNKQIGGSP